MIKPPIQLTKWQVFHTLHCCIMLSIAWLQLLVYYRFQWSDTAHVDMNERYGYVGTVIVTFLHFAPFVPQFLPTMCNLIGLTKHNCFSGINVVLRQPAEKAPFLCFRTVTRGLFPELVKGNAFRNRDLCLKMGLKNFHVEILTDSYLGNLLNEPHVKQTVVPDGYATPKGTKYKARALQYALEGHVNTLGDTDWIVHLDEESLLTPNSVRGILNFAADGRHHIGQGLIMYANEHVVNWLTTCMDAYRVADDLGKLKFQLKDLHRVILDWKGSFLMCQAGVENLVSFDHGPAGSITEDIFFGLKATTMGFSFGYIEGEVWEKSPFTLVDFMKQRKRWVEGCHHITFMPSMPLVARWTYITGRVSTVLFGTMVYPMLCRAYIPMGPDATTVFEIYMLMSGLLALYMHALGAVVSFMLYSKNGWKKLVLNLVAVPFLATLQGFLNVIVNVVTIFSSKTSFTIVNKNYSQLVPSGTQSRTV